jgi:hypothetical protein
MKSKFVKRRITIFMMIFLVFVVVSLLLKPLKDQRKLVVKLRSYI